MTVELKFPTKERIDQLLIDCGHAINANNGRCDLIEDVLCKTTTLVLEMEAAINEQVMALEMVQDIITAPDPNCSCHIRPPCGDCTDYAAIREVLATVKAALAKKKGGA